METSSPDLTPTHRQISYPELGWPTFARTAGRFPGGDLFDHLALIASAGECDAEALLRLSRSGGRPAKLDLRALAWFAHVTASRIDIPTRFNDVVDLFEMGHRGGNPSLLFAKQLDDVWIQAWYLSGRIDQGRDRLPRSPRTSETWWTVDTDSAHPGVVSSDSVEWLSLFNAPMHEAGLEPVTLMDGAAESFDRLVCDVPRLPADEGPLVSVVIPVYNPSASLRTAVNSLLAQTWSNVEIILADDASTSGQALFDEVLALDPRIRTIRAPRNAGAYPARNMGMRAARGEYITFNDADDWAHPRKIERQVRAVIDAPERRASISWAIRVTEELKLTVIGRPTKRVNLSSILMRRTDVLDQLGGFDTVRKGADSEFVERFRAHFGADSLVEMRDPLSLVQLTSGSLSRDDYRFLRTHPARQAYVASFRHWHSTLIEGSDSAYVAHGVRAPFRAPAVVEGQPSESVDADVLILGNLAPEAPTVIDLAAETSALVDAGYCVAVSEFVGLFDLTSSLRPQSGDVRALLSAGVVDQVVAGDPARSDLVVVRDPSAVDAMPSAHLQVITTRRVLVVADYSPSSGAHFNPKAVEESLSGSLTDEIVWLPATIEIATELRALGACEVLSPAPFGVAPLRPHCSREVGPRPRVAVFPSAMWRAPTHTMRTQLRQLVPPSDIADVVTVAPRRVASLLPDQVPLLPTGETPTSEVCALVDVVVVGETTGRGGYSNRAALLAMSHGCVVIAHPELRGHLGEAALYLDEDDVRNWIARLADTPELFATQQALGWRHVCNHASPECLTQLVGAAIAVDPKGLM